MKKLIEKLKAWLKAIVEWFKMLMTKLKRFWYFNFANPVVLKGKEGGFEWVFRRFWLEYRTVSGNWKLRVTAGAHPHGYLLAGAMKGDNNNVHGFAMTMYMQSMLLTQDQGLVSDIQRAIRKCDRRLQKQEASKMKEEDRQDEIALEAVKQEQEFVELPKKEQRKVEREVNGRFKKVVKDAQKSGK